MTSPPTEPAVRTLIVGDDPTGEFAAAVACLEADSSAQRVGGIDAALDRLAASEAACDWLVVLQAWPGQWSHAQLDRLQRAAPLARVILVLGSWCEGETRSGRPWPAAQRVYWHQAAARLSEQIRRHRQGRPSGWSLPVTASDEERLLSNLPPAPTVLSGHVLIVARRSDAASCLSAACASWGLSTTIVGRLPVEHEPCDVVLWDIEGAAECGSLSAVAGSGGEAPACPPAAPLVVLVGFPRLDQYQQWLGAPAAAVLSKPLVLSDLYDTLARLLKRACRTESRQA